MSAIKPILKLVGYLSLFCLLIQPVAAQNLYNDALQLSQALEKNEVKVIVKSDTIIRMYMEVEGSFPEPYMEFLPPMDSVILDKYALYQLQGEGQPFYTKIVYDTLSEQLKSGNQDISINHKADAVTLIKKGEMVRSIPKYHFWTIHVLLGTHLDGRLAGLQPQEYNSLDTYNAAKNNPFLGRLVDYDLFAAADFDQKQQFSKAVEQNIQISKNKYANFLENLYADSLYWAEQVFSVKDIQAEYEEPVLNSAEALVDVSQTIAAQSNNESGGFSTETMLAGLSDFIVDRAQEEFNITFMDRFRERLNDSTYIELHTLFPASHDFLNQIDINNYKSVLLAARQSFVSDIENVSFNFPKIFELPQHEAIRNRPEVYDLLLMYSIIDLIYRGHSIDEILPLSYRKVQGRCQELDKAINLRLAGKEEVTQEREALAVKITQLENDLITARDSLLDRQLALEFKFSAAALIEDEGARKAINTLYFDYYQEVDFINKEIANAWDTIRQIPSNLRGKVFYDDIMQEPSIDEFHKYFCDDPNPTQLIGAGLELTRYMVNGVGGKPNKARLLLQWDELIQKTEAQFNILEDSITAMSVLGLERKLTKLEIQRQSLKDDLLADISFWKQTRSSEHDSMALVYLSRTLDTPVFTERSALSPLELIGERKAQLDKTIEIIIDKLSLLAEKTGTRSPLLIKLTAEDTPTLSIFEPNAHLLDLLKKSNEIRIELNRLDEAYAQDLLIAKKNAALLGKILELTSHMMYFFQTGEGEEKSWITKSEMENILADDVLRDVFFGLIHQRLSSLYPTSQFSNKGIATIATSFVSDFTYIHEQQLLLATKKAENKNPDFKDYFPFVRIALNIVNTIMETPILISDEDGETVYKLTEVDPSLTFIPQIADNTLNLFENIHNERYNFAIYNILELYKIISERTLENCNEKEDKADRYACYENERIRNALLVYGTFIADVALAQEAEDVQRALELVALPPGSSRIKRQQNFNVSVNSYLGIGIGHERLTNKSIPNNSKFINTASLTVPVGISMSWKFKPQQKGSFSFFVPIIDLGAITAFRVEDRTATLPELSFQNIISPGAYLMYNFEKSPFTLGAGWQFGPQTRAINIDGVLYTSSASRFMLTASIDVPVFNLFGNR